MAAHEAHQQGADAETRAVAEGLARAEQQERDAQAVLEALVGVQELLLADLKAAATRAQAAHARKLAACRQQHHDGIMLLQLQHEARARELEEALAEARAQAAHATVALETALATAAELENQVRPAAPARRTAAPR